MTLGMGTDALLYKPRAAAELLGISVKLLYRHIHEGTLVALDLGLVGNRKPTIRIHRTEINRWLAGLGTAK